MSNRITKVIAIVVSFAAYTLVGARLPLRISATVAAQPSAPGACSVLSVEELEKMLGRQFGRSRERQEQSGTSCRFTAGAGGSITVSVATTSKADFEQFRKLLGDQGKKPEAVSGVGDDAYYWDDRIYVRVGNRSMAIWNGEPQPSSEKPRREVLTIAKALAPKLK